MKRKKNGWATLELVLLLPLIFALIALVFYFGQLAFLKLHLTSATDAAARIAAVQGCNAAKSYIRESFSTSADLQIECSEGEIISMTVKGSLETQLPLVHLLKKKITVHAYAVNEKQLSSDQP